MESSENPRQIRLQFAADEADAESIETLEAVIVWPSKDKWNDQGYRLLIDFMIKADGQVYRPKRPAAMIFAHFRDAHEGIVSLGNSKRHPNEVASFSEFASLQMDVNEYRRIGRTFEPETAFLALEAMHDLVVEEQKAKPRTWLAEVKKMGAFTFALLRPTSRYFAYRRGYDFLIGNEVEAVSKASASAALTFRLDAFSDAHEIPLSFGSAETVSHRINVLIGRNGVGKSQTLARLVTALASPRSKKARIDPEGEFNRVIAFSGIAGQTALPKRNPAPRMLQYHFYNLSPGQTRRGRHPITAALLDLIRSDDYLQNMRRLDVFAEAVRGWISLKQIYLPLQKDEPEGGRNLRNVIAKGSTSYVSVQEILSVNEMYQLVNMGDIDLSKGPLFRFGEGLTQLSSGQELFFRFALHLCESIDAGALVLIDELENHLHPNFITDLMALLRQILAQTGSFALIASHSPFVVREVTHNDVIILDRGEDGSPRVRRPRLRTLGASVAAVSLYVFGDETIPTLARLTLESQGLPNGSIDEAVFNRLSAEYSNEAISYMRSVLLERESTNKNGGAQ